MVRYTLKQLTYFSAIAQHGGIAQASRALNISQPALASALDKLESQLGFRLFHRRHSRGTELTPQGQEALSQARWLLQSAEQAARDFQAIAAELVGHLRFGCFHTLAPFYAPGLVAEMRDRYPGVAVDVTEGRHDELVSSLVDHSLDLALLYAMDLDARGLQWGHLHSLLPYVVLPAGHPLADHKSINLAALAAEPYVMFDWPTTRQYFKSVLDIGGIDPPVSFRSQSFEVVRSAVASGLGFSLLLVRPKTDVTYNGTIVVCRPITQQVPPLDIVVAWPADVASSILREHFVGLCRGHLAQEGTTANSSVSQCRAG